MLSEFIAKIKDGKDLGAAEASSVLDRVLAPGCPDDQISDLLVALADKGETAEELAGFARVMRKHAVSIKTEHETVVDTAGTGGGAETFNVSTAAAFVIAGSGIRVAKHGNRAITSRSGSADVLAALGVEVDQPPEVAESALEKLGLCFLFAPSFHPAMKRVAATRKKLGRRTIFNLLGPLTNPASAAYQLVGVYEQALTEKLAGALQILGCKRAWVVHSHDGLDELSVSDLTRVTEVKDDQIRSFDFHPLELRIGIPAGGEPRENAALIRGILNGRVGGPAREIVVLNAAAAIHIAADISFSEALQSADEAISKGRAAEKLAGLAEFYGGQR